MAVIDLEDMPRRLNGYAVHAFNRRADRVLVICHRPDHPLHPWVGATWWPELGTTWMWGHYFATEAEAEEWRTAENDRHYWGEAEPIPTHTTDEDDFYRGIPTTDEADE